MEYRIINYIEVTGSSLWLILFPMLPLITVPVGLPVHILFFAVLVVTFVHTWFLLWFSFVVCR